MSGDLLHGALTNLEGERLDQTKENLEACWRCGNKRLIQGISMGTHTVPNRRKRGSHTASLRLRQDPQDGRIMKRLRDKFIDDDAIVTKISSRYLRCKTAAIRLE